MKTISQPVSGADQPFRLLRLTGLLLMAISLVASATGCKSTSAPPMPAAATPAALATEATRLNPGDVVQITFPAASAMNTTERVRIDGKLFLPLVGEVAAAGKTPAELQADLVSAYSKQLQVTEVVVIMASSAASIFVSGAVNKPGRIAMERPMTILDAIMEAGGFDPRRANVKKITVIRQKDGQYSRRLFNLKPVLKGEQVAPFALQPFDIVFVPEKLF